MTGAVSASRKLRAASWAASGRNIVPKLPPAPSNKTQSFGHELNNAWDAVRTLKTTATSCEPTRAKLSQELIAARTGDIRAYRAIERAVLTERVEKERQELSGLLFRVSMQAIRAFVKKGDIQSGADVAYGTVETLNRVDDRTRLRWYLRNFSEDLPKEIVVSAVLSAAKHEKVPDEITDLINRLEAHLVRANDPSTEELIRHLKS